MRSDSSRTGDPHLERDIELALEFAGRAVASAREAEKQKLVAIAAALDHGASLPQVSEVTGYSVATLRRIAARMRRSEQAEGEAV